MEETCKDLPEECWELVVGHLDNHQRWEPLSLVSKELLSVTNRLRVSLKVIHPTVAILSKQLQKFQHLKQIDLSHFHGSLEEALLEITQSGVNIENLNISGASSPPIKLLKELSSCMNNLKVFSCSRSHLNNDDLLVLSESFPSLEELDISYQHTQGITDRGIVTLSMKLKRLQKINLGGNRLISDESLISLANNCVLLKEILLRYCSNVSHTGISFVIENSPCCSSLTLASDIFQTLELVNPLNPSKQITTIDLSHIKVSDDFLYGIAKANLPLKNFHLTNCSFFTITGIYSLMNAYKSLTSFTLTNIDFLTDESVVYICQFIGNLISIKVNGCYKLTTSTFINISSACPLLSHIEVSSPSSTNSGPYYASGFTTNPSITSVYVDSIALKITLPICSNFHVLEVCTLGDSHELDISVILRYCHKIRVLTIHGCQRLAFTGEGEGGICNLERLSVQSSEGMNDQVLRMVGKKCAKLLYLNLYSCMRMTERGLREVVERCTQLRYVDLDCCTKVNKDIVAWMVASCPSLRKIVTPGAFDHARNELQSFLQQGCLVTPGSWKEHYY